MPREQGEILQLFMGYAEKYRNEIAHAFAGTEDDTYEDDEERHGMEDAGEYGPISEERLASETENMIGVLKDAEKALSGMSKQYEQSYEHALGDVRMAVSKIEQQYDDDEEVPEQVRELRDELEKMKH